jgi:hypothetical protein
LPSSSWIGIIASRRLHVISIDRPVTSSVDFQETGVTCRVGYALVSCNRSQKKYEVYTETGDE